MTTKMSDSNAAFLGNAKKVLDVLSTSLGDENFLDRTIDALEIPVVVTEDSRGQDMPTILKVNPSFETMCGYTNEEVCGLSPKILQGSETDLVAAHDFRNRLETHGQALSVLVNYRKDGSPYEVMLLASRLRLLDGQDSKSSDFFISFAFFLNDAPICLLRDEEKSLN